LSFEPFGVAADFWARVLSPRELDVASLVAGGLSNKEIARALGITEGTVEVHMNKLLRKLGARNRYALLLEARKDAEQSA
jgi:DNA-binding NarL/FixJ family response regulator